VDGDATHSPGPLMILAARTRLGPERHAGRRDYPPTQSRGTCRVRRRQAENVRYLEPLAEEDGKLLSADAERISDGHVVRLAGCDLWDRRRAFLNACRRTVRPGQRWCKSRSASTRVSRRTAQAWSNPALEILIGAGIYETMEAAPEWWNGRHSRLKICWGEVPVWVRVPPSAPHLFRVRHLCASRATFDSRQQF
jgi:hypothetical protein